MIFLCCFLQDETNVNLIWVKIMDRVWVIWEILHASVKMNGKVERAIWETAIVIVTRVEMEETTLI